MLQNIIYSISVPFIIAGIASASSINLVALVPANEHFQTVLDGIRDQAGPGYHIDVIDINTKPTVKTIADQCISIKAAGLILMDIKAANVVLELQKYDSAFMALPKFVLMTLLAELNAKGLSNAAGISFEVPLYTLITNFRIISQKDFSRIGIFYRNSFTRSIEESKKLLEKEKIALSAICVDCDQNQKTSIENALGVMNASLDRMVAQEKIEVFIVPADNLIVNSKSLSGFWMGKINKKRIPVIATIDFLASEQFGTAVFTADPDLSQLGAQAANQIVEHFENKIPMDKIGFEPTISIKSTLNMNVAEKLGWKLKSEKLGRISTIIK
jgi:ABC-type uncharacterized transport system substrate-binding protein